MHHTQHQWSTASTLQYDDMSRVKCRQYLQNVTASAHHFLLVSLVYQIVKGNRSSHVCMYPTACVGSPEDKASKVVIHLSAVSKAGDCGKTQCTMFDRSTLTLNNSKKVKNVKFLFCVLLY